MPKTSSKTCCEDCETGVCSAAQCACETSAAPPPKAVAPPVKKAPVMVLTPKGRVSETLLRAGIVRLAPPAGTDDTLRAGGIDPATLRAIPGAAVVLDNTRYTALAEVLLGRLVYDAEEGVWRHVLRAPEVTVVSVGQAPRPSFEALREAHLDHQRWLLMGGACAGVNR